MVLVLIDVKGFRSNIGIILANKEDQVLWGKRVGKREAWQFPQGGMHEGETPEQTLFRELNEEIGLSKSDVSIVGRTRHWLRYRIPKHMIRKTEPVCIGQKQLWFLLRLETDESRINLEKTVKPEFAHWQWVSYWYPIREVVAFKKDVYRRALNELAPYIFKNATRNGRAQSLNRLLDE